MCFFGKLILNVSIINFSENKKRMDDYEKHDTDGIKCSKNRDKYEKSRGRRSKFDKDRSPVHSHRYFLNYTNISLFIALINIIINVK